MSLKKIQLESIYNGQSPSYLIGGDYLSSIAIDPDADVSTSIKKIAGAITPTTHNSFATLDGNPMWIKPNPITSDTLIYTDTGKLYQYNNELESIGSPITLSNASGNGLVYYKNYYYAIKNTDIDRFNAETLEQEENWFGNLKEKDVILATSFNQFQTAEFNQFYFGNGQTYSEIAQYIPNSIIDGNIQINKFRFQAKAFGATSLTLRVRVYQNPNTDNPYAGLVDTRTVTIDDTMKSYEIDIRASIQDGASNLWLRIDKQGGFGTGEYVQIVTTTQSALSSANLYGFTSNWVIPSDQNQKNLAFFLYNEYKAFPQLQNTEYPYNGIARIPNHTVHTHTSSDETMFISDFSGNEGRIHSIQMLEEVILYDTFAQLPVAGVSKIYGKDSLASADVVGVDQGFRNSPKGSNSVTKLTIINKQGEFIEDEIIRGADFFQFGKYQSGTVGKARGSIRLNALNLPQGMLPVSIESFGSDLAVLAINGTDQNIKQGSARLYLWDCFDVSFYREIKLPYTTATALLAHNGTPFLWGGDDRGYSFSQYVGGDSVSEIFYVDDGLPPFSGAVSGENNRIIWGTNTEYPEQTGAVLAYGSRNASLPRGIHNIARADKQVTSLIVGTKNTENIVIGSEDALLKPGGQYQSVFRTKIINIGKNFTLKQITIPLAKAVNENTTIEVKAFVDNESRSKSINAINSSNHNGKNKVVDYFEISGENNFFIEFKWSGTEPLPILLPLTIEVEILED